MLTTRDVQPELMDQPGLAVDSHHVALAALGRINRISRTGDVVWKPIRRLAAAARGEPLRVLDVACGGGDVVRSLAERARRAGLPIEFSACDISDVAVSFAHERAERAGLGSIRFFPCDALRDELPGEYDVVTCTLFLHHLDLASAETLLTRLSRAARRLLLIDDLRRTTVGYALAWCAGRLLTRSPVVRTDGPLSVKAAFTRTELLQMAARCRLDGATVHTHFPQRMLLSWERMP